MDIKYDINEIFLKPETDFETEVISNFRECTVFVKCGMSPKEVLGIVIRRKENPHGKKNKLE